MAKNPNQELPNKHVIYIATSGAGKSQALGANPDYQQAKRVLLWDTHQDFKATRFSTIAELARAVKAAESKNINFRYAYSGPRKDSAFNHFCRIVWAIADGNKLLRVVIDELADVTGGPGKERGPLGELLRGGRKFGLIVHCTATRAAEIPKTIFTQSKIKYVGIQDSISDAKTMADVLMIKPDNILNLENLQFYRKESNKPAEKIQIKYKSPPL